MFIAAVKREGSVRVRECRAVQLSDPTSGAADVAVPSLYLPSHLHLEQLLAYLSVHTVWHLQLLSQLHREWCFGSSMQGWG